MNTKLDLLNELIATQRKDVYYAKKLTYKDLNRIVKYIDKSMFGEECSIWKGYVSCPNVDNPNYYINFFFKNKKVGLHRLLYLNFVGDITSNDFIKYTCINQGKCCNVNHFVKFSSDKNNEDSDGDEDDEIEEVDEVDEVVEDIKIEENNYKRNDKNDDDFKVFF